MMFKQKVPWRMPSLIPKVLNQRRDAFVWACSDCSALFYAKRAEGLQTESEVEEVNRDFSKHCKRQHPKTQPVVGLCSELKTPSAPRSNRIRSFLGALVTPYHCRTCGARIGIRSRNRSLTERYLLPFVLLQPVRCANCFRRDYWLLFTPVLERNEHKPECSGHALPRKLAEDSPLREALRVEARNFGVDFDSFRHTQAKGAIRTVSRSSRLISAMQNADSIGTDVLAIPEASALKKAS